MPVRMQICAAAGGGGGGADGHVAAPQARGRLPALGKAAAPV